MDICGKNISGNKTSKCQILKVDVCLVYLRKSKEDNEVSTRVSERESGRR